MPSPTCFVDQESQIRSRVSLDPSDHFPERHTVTRLETLLCQDFRPDLRAELYAQNLIQACECMHHSKDEP